jgi:hypothetical protein
MHACQDMNLKLKKGKRIVGAKEVIARLMHE